MAIGMRNNATPAPGNGGLFSTILVDPVSARAVKFIEALAGLSEFGIRFPYNNGSTTNLSVSSNQNFAAQVNYYDEVEVTGTAVLSTTVSPTFLFCHKLTVASGAVISADGMGGPGGVGAIQGTRLAQHGGKGDLGADTVSDAPQYPYGIASGGGGGSGSSTVAGGSDRAGGGGRASGLLLGPSAVTATNTNGGDGAAFETLKLLGKVLPYAFTHRGGGGGGGGGHSGGTGATGGDGGPGGGILFIVTELWDVEGTIRARGIAGGNGSVATSGGGGGGGGGLLVALTAASLNDGTFVVTGGPGGSPFGGAGEGGDGGDGFYLFNKVA